MVLPFIVSRFASSPEALVTAALLSVANAIIIIVREWDQWPPRNRWWDPWVDWTFYLLGVATALTLGFTVLR